MGLLWATVDINMFLIVYVRVIDNKKDGLIMEGPFYGSEHPSMEEAQEKCHKLTAATKDHILIKIYSLDGIDYPKAKKMSSVHFDRVLTT